MAHSQGPRVGRFRRVSAIALAVLVAGVSVGAAGCGDNADNAVDAATSAIDEGVDTATSSADDAIDSATNSAAERTEVMVTLDEQNGSGQTGTATLTRVDATTTRVVVTVENPPAEPQPAHIHMGTCTDLNPAPQYPLENITDGNSTSTVAARLDALLADNMAINVHRSAEQADLYVACGTIEG